MKTIICYGDSNTWGFIPKKEKPTITDCRYDENTRWTGRLQNILGNNYKIIEEGLNARTTCLNDPYNKDLNGMDYISICMQTNMPVDLVILMLGINDMKKYFNVDAFNSARGIEQLVLKIQNICYGQNMCAPEILIVAPVNIAKNIESTWTGKEFGKHCIERNKNMGIFFREIAQKNNCFFLDANDFVSADANDAVHLNEKSHKLLGETIGKKVTEILGNTK